MPVMLNQDGAAPCSGLPPRLRHRPPQQSLYSRRDCRGGDGGRNVSVRDGASPPKAPRVGRHLAPRFRAAPPLFPFCSFLFCLVFLLHRGSAKTPYCIRTLVNKQRCCTLRCRGQGVPVGVRPERTLYKVVDSLD